MKKRENIERELTEANKLYCEIMCAMEDLYHKKTNLFVNMVGFKVEDNFEEMKMLLKMFNTNQELLRKKIEKLNSI